MSPEQQLRFYNMVIHLVQKDKLYEENVAVKKVWRKDNNIFFDIYFYRTQKSYVFDSAFVHDLLDLTNEKYYRNPEDFLLDFEAFDTAAENRMPEVVSVDERLFEPLHLDLVIMIYLASCCENFSDIKEKIIYDYILRHIPAAASLTPQYVGTYLRSVNPQNEDFYEALENIKSKHPDEAEEIVRETVKICLADGQLHYGEKLYLAEIFQVLREQGVNPDVGL